MVRHRMKMKKVAISPEAVASVKVDGMPSFMLKLNGELIGNFDFLKAPSWTMANLCCESVDFVDKGILVQPASAESIGPQMHAS